MAPLCILREEEQTIDIFSPSVVTVTPFWLLLKIVLTLSFLRHHLKMSLLGHTYAGIFGILPRKIKRSFCKRPLAKPFLHNERHTIDPRLQSQTQSHAKYFKNISFSSLQHMPMGLLSSTQKWKTLFELVCAVSTNGNRFSPVTLLIFTFICLRPSR